MGATSFLSGCRPVDRGTWSAPERRCPAALCAGVSVRRLVDQALGELEDGEDLDEAERDEAVRQIIAEVSEAVPVGWEKAEWDAVTNRLQPRVVTARNEVARLPVPVRARAA